MSRRRMLFLLAAGVVLFLVVSTLLARVFSAESAERSALTALIRAEAAGNLDHAIVQIRGCAATPACRQGLAGIVAKLQRPGSVSILAINSSAGFSLGSTLGVARVAWSVGSSLPIVQCVRVRHAGNAFSGLRVDLLAVTPRLKSDAVCPNRF